MYKMAQKDTNFPLVKVNLPEKDKTNSTVRIWQDPKRKALNGSVSNVLGLFLLQLSDSYSLLCEVQSVGYSVQCWMLVGFAVFCPLRSSYVSEHLQTALILRGIAVFNASSFSQTRNLYRYLAVSGAEWDNRTRIKNANTNHSDYRCFTLNVLRRTFRFIL